jgi:hypothetical protein
VTDSITENLTSRDETPEEWWTRRRYSKSTYYKLKRLGLAPAELRVPGTSIVRITRQADREWERLMAERAREQSAELERQRRVEACRRAGRAAAQSIYHVSKRAKRRVR